MYNNSGIYNLCSNLTQPWLLSPGVHRANKLASQRAVIRRHCSNFAQRPVPRRTFERSAAAAAAAEPEWVHLAV